MRTRYALLYCSAIAMFSSCEKLDDFLGHPNTDGEDTAKTVELKNHSKTPTFAKVAPEFSDIEIYSLLSSEDKLAGSPDFIYGSMADGTGLLKEADGTYTLINNIEADYAIARIKLDETFKPVSGEYILNAEATAETAQCSGTLVTPEEHGFGPIYLSGGEWNGSLNGVFAVDPYKSAENASVATILPAMGKFITEQAVPLSKEAYPGKTVVLIGDDHSDNDIPSGQLGMYVGPRGDLNSGSLYGLKVLNDSIMYEMDMAEGESYEAEFVELNEVGSTDLLDAEAKEKGVMGFSRVEDIDWRRGVVSNHREIYFCVTGRKTDALLGKGTAFGRIYKVVLDENDPLKGTITCVLDGDKLDGMAKNFLSPDNITVTKNYAYIQEDPAATPDSPEKTHYARLYQYNLNTGELKTVLECDQASAVAQGYGNLDTTWEIEGMIDVSDIIGVEDSFVICFQNHGWVPADGSAFTDPKANMDPNSNKEGSQLFVIKGLGR
ncbi:phosphatase [Zobellia alginiliquefaciens]|uniref:phosphatase n=1 Tax=Zobellia alginiliquefaciens TaxID=3032586 RepID=UPI0023E43EAF|nr:phosphatase [Zobellia alginiliquefaciens]